MLITHDAAIIKGMLARGDKQHDIAALFHENGARVADIKTGKTFSDVAPAPGDVVPPPRPPRLLIDPQAPVERQFTILMQLIRQPPEASHIVTFTPGLCEMVLARLNPQNRKPSRAKIKRYAQDMQAQSWFLNGETVTFRRSGILGDGQTRMRACVVAGEAFASHVIFGIDDAAFPSINTGKTRNNADVLAIAGIPNSAATAAAIRWLMIFLRNPRDRGATIENKAVLDYYNTVADQEILERSIRCAKTVGRPFPVGSLAALLYRFVMSDPTTALRFAHDLVKRKRGARLLAVKLEKLRVQNMGRMNELQNNALIIQAWNSYRLGRPLRSDDLNWNETKEYPVIG